MPLRRYDYRILLLGAVLMSGCSDPDAVQLAPVTGTVTVEGKPLTKGVVSLRPDSAGTLHHPTGTIDPQGNYKLTTIGREGAPLGKYKVLVFVDGNTQDGKSAHPSMPKWLIHERYTSERTTDLTLEVVETPQPGRYDLKLKK